MAKSLFDQACLIIMYGIIIFIFIYVVKKIYNPKSITYPNIYVSHPGFKPNKNGSTGISPSGGMRPRFKIPYETDIGYWGVTPKYTDNYKSNIYDNSDPFGEYIIDIGWWNK